MNTLPWPGFLHEFAVAARAQGFSEHTLCRTLAGPVQAWTRGSQDPPNIMLSAGIHGDEPAGPLAMLACLRSGDFTTDISWSLCPALNPTGLQAKTRENHHGMDLNRDYRTRRSAEVSAHIEWLTTQPTPDMFLSLHEDWESKGFYLYEINQGPDAPARSTSILEAVKPWFDADPGPIIDGHKIRSPGWIYHPAEADLPEEWPEAIHLAKHGCPLSFTFETPSSAKLTHRVAALRDAVRAACHAI